MIGFPRMQGATCHILPAIGMSLYVIGPSFQILATHNLHNLDARGIDPAIIDGCSAGDPCWWHEVGASLDLVLAAEEMDRRGAT